MQGLPLEKREQKQLTIPLALSQTTALETYNRMIETDTLWNYDHPARKYGTAVCTSIC